MALLKRCVTGDGLVCHWGWTCGFAEVYLFVISLTFILPGVPVSFLTINRGVTNVAVAGCGGTHR